MQPLSWLWLVPLVAAATAAPRCPPGCHCLGDLLHVVCENKGLRKVPRVSNKVRLLSLQQNNFPVLPAGGFSTLKSLVSLHMQGCSIREIRAGAFRRLKKLVYLYLSNNEISSIRPGAFQDLSQLTYLYLDHNRISDLSKGLLSPLNSLFLLQLSHNRMGQIGPGSFAGARELRWLHLSNNGLTSIAPGALDDVENLATLHLDDNKLSSYPAAALSKLRVVEELRLDSNPIRTVPDNAFHSFGRYVERIWLTHMQLEKVRCRAARRRKATGRAGDKVAWATWMGHPGHGRGGRWGGRPALGCPGEGRTSRYTVSRSREWARARATGSLVARCRGRARTGRPGNGRGLAAPGVRRPGLRAWMERVRCARY